MVLAVVVQLARPVDGLQAKFEASALLGGGAVVAGVADAERAADALRARGYGGVVIKLGAFGCYVAMGATRCHVPGHAVTVVDTTAAGDTFNGALAVALGEGAEPVAAAQLANAAAALSVTRAGAQSSVPTRDEAAALLGGR